MKAIISITSIILGICLALGSVWSCFFVWLEVLPYGWYFFESEFWWRIPMQVSLVAYGFGVFVLGVLAFAVGLALLFE